MYSLSAEPVSSARNAIAKNTTKRNIAPSTYGDLLSDGRHRIVVVVVVEMRMSVKPCVVHTRPMIGMRSAEIASANGNALNFKPFEFREHRPRS